MNVKAELLTKNSAKTKKDYKVLELTFPTGYKLKVFLNDDQLYIVENIK